MSYLKHKPGSIEELMASKAKMMKDNAYQDMFKKELDKAGKGIGSMSPKEKKDFFNKIDSKYKAKSEGGPGSGPQGGETRGTYKTGHKKSVMKPGAGKRPGSAPDGGQTDKEADDYDTEMGEALGKEDDSVVKKVVNQLKKAVKAHDGQAKDLEKAMKEARFEVEGRVDYKGVSGGDDFSIVVDASNEKAAEKKVEDMLFKHRDQRKIGPRGGRGVDDYEIESVERTSKSVTNKFSTYHAAEKDPSIKEADQHGDEINDKKHDAMKKGDKEPKKIADSGSKLTKVETEPKVDYKN